MARRKSLAERLGFLGLGCFGVKIQNADLDDDTGAPVINEMNLRAAEDQPLVPLMRLIEVIDFENEVEEIIMVRTLVDASVCRMCMARKKISELVPCQHPFCRGCARKLWFDRATCPLCFHWIKDYLDLF